MLKILFLALLSVTFLTVCHSSNAEMEEFKGQLEKDVPIGSDVAAVEARLRQKSLAFALQPGTAISPSGKECTSMLVWIEKLSSSEGKYYMRARLYFDLEEDKLVEFEFSKSYRDTL